MVEAIRGHLLTVPMGSYLPVGLCAYDEEAQHIVLQKRHFVGSNPTMHFG